jgi:K+ transporter
MTLWDALCMWLIITALVTVGTYRLILNLPNFMHGDYLSILVMGLMFVGVWFIIELETAIALEELSRQRRRVM